MRTRAHYNPFNVRDPIETPSWEEIFPNSSESTIGAIMPMDYELLKESNEFYNIIDKLKRRRRIRVRFLDETLLKLNELIANIQKEIDKLEN